MLRRTIGRLAPPRLLGARAKGPLRLSTYSTTSKTGEPLERNQQQQQQQPPPLRGAEDLDTMRRRLQYQMRKRGILETDLLLSTFASEYLHVLGKEELADLDALLSNIDWDIFYWATKKTVPPKAIQDMSVFQKLVEHAAKRGNTIVRMPDLEDSKKQ
ncbi:Succinate dehydrogenase assembly factor 2 mitochondrial [Coemansia sp. RSA 2399]|nr:Succinate dehydrogenase assembly factor 2 mitochondrial [Coemansia sp. RSA 2399]KAJ1896290.1 Succinate dehydrogenase assembly factor 2 mitochondrial [Coemansia sp. IMI 209127]